MSARPNDEWLEAAKETFGEAIEDKKFSFAKDIIGDTRDAGFSGAAEKMEEQLAAAQTEDEKII